MRAAAEAAEVRLGARITMNQNCDLTKILTLTLILPLPLILTLTQVKKILAQYQQAADKKQKDLVAKYKVAALVLTMASEIPQGLSQSSYPLLGISTFMMIHLMLSEP